MRAASRRKISRSSFANSTRSSSSSSFVRFASALRSLCAISVVLTAFFGRRLDISRPFPLLDIKQLDDEVQSGVGRNCAGGAGGAVAEVGRNFELDHAALANQLHPLGPALDHAIEW